LHFTVNSDKIVKNSVERVLYIMKKKIFSLIMSLCLIVTMFSIGASAVEVEVDQIPTIVRLCPGTVIGDNTDHLLPAPNVYGSVYVQGWEIKLEGGDWVPYHGEVLDETYDGALIRYYAAPFSNNEADYVYSNECDLICKHNPKGPYKYSGTDHWRECADCGGKDGEELHDFFDSFDTNHEDLDSVCQVCGAKRTSQWTGLAGFLSWIFREILSLFL
jgi:hypothetical protein